MKQAGVRHVAVLFCAACLFASCATIPSVRPLPRGRQQADASLGGPLFTDLGFPMPIPLLDLSYLYGLTDNVSLGGSIYVTDALFGTGHLEGTAIWGIIPQRGALPAVSLDGNLHLVTDFKSSLQFFPELNLTPSWAVGSFLFYGGAGAMFNLYPNMANGTKREYLAIPDFYLGARWRGARWGFTAELKYLNPFQPNYPAAPAYVGIGQWGALAPFFAASYRFGGRR